LDRVRAVWENDMTGLENKESAVGQRSTIPLSDNSRAVLERRYLRRGANGKPIETIEEMFYRVAFHVAQPEKESGGDAEGTTAAFFELLTQLKFMPNSPTFTGAGTPLGQLAACFVLPITDDMGRDEAGIFQTLRDAALIQQTGGGNGFAFSRLRPKGALVRSSAGQATGPVGFLRVYDQAFGEIAQSIIRTYASSYAARPTKTRSPISISVSESPMRSWRLCATMNLSS
jgi:ribonucleoside-diphosphate reductase alpha chain